jgi:hypothetical protein
MAVTGLASLAVKVAGLDAALAGRAHVYLGPVIRPRQREINAGIRGNGIDPTGPHFCVLVDDLDAAIRELDSRGIEHLRAARGDVVQIWITDPAGNTIELQQDPEARA